MKRLAISRSLSVASVEPEISRHQAELFRRRFEGWGRYGLSAFYARSDDEVLDLGEDRLDAFATLFVYRLADVIEAGFEVVPTYRSPHVTITFYDDVDTGVALTTSDQARTPPPAADPNRSRCTGRATAHPRPTPIAQQSPSSVAISGTCLADNMAICWSLRPFFSVMRPSTSMSFSRRRSGSLVSMPTTLASGPTR